MVTDEQRNALLALVDGIVDAVRVAGEWGAPGGIIYAALMASGCTFDQFTVIMGTLVRVGKLTKRGELYFVAAGA